jgi:hypothetical protein
LEAQQQQQQRSAVRMQVKPVKKTDQCTNLVVCSADTLCERQHLLLLARLRGLHISTACIRASMLHTMIFNMLIDAGAPRVECTRPGVDLSLLAVQGGLVTCCLAVFMQYVFVANSSCIFAESIRFRTAM